MTISLQSHIVYGPMDSRRFGSSLGINLLPTDQKVCNMNCVYCQYGDSSLSCPPIFPSLQDIEAEAGAYFEQAGDHFEVLDWIILAGNGEPTLYPHFRAAVDILISLRDRHLPEVPIGILSNSSTCHRPEVRQALAKLDGRFMKLDAGAASSFYRINRPAQSARWGDVVSGLYCMKKVVLQSLFFTGDLQNVDEDTVSDWLQAVNYIEPEAVQIYTVDRPPQEEGILPVSRRMLEWISKRLNEKTGIRGLVF